VRDHPGSVAVSATTRDGIEVFLRTMADRLRTLSVVHELVVPYERGDILAAVHREGEVVSVADGADAWTIRARLSDASAGRLSEFAVDTPT
jgi:GTP-binding protein HflX